MAALFSVILPTCDRPGLLRRAIESVLAQSIHDWELIVVDDGIDTPARVPSDERIRLIRNGRNRGPAFARNVGLEAAEGRLITFLDDDDLFVPNRLELGNGSLDDGSISICWARFADESAGKGRLLDGWVFDRILDSSTPSLGCAVLPRELAPRFDEQWHAVEDVVWWMEVSRRAPVHTVPEPGYLVGRHDGRRNRNHLEARMAENLSLLEAKSGYFADHPQALAFRWRRIGLMADAIGDRSRARSAFVQSLLHRPALATLWHLARSLAPRWMPPGLASSSRPHLTGESPPAD